MGRKTKKEEDKKVKFTISIDPKLYTTMCEQKIKKSRLIETLLKKYYGNTNMH